MTLQEAKQKVASNHSYVDWYQLRAHCKGYEGDLDPRMLTYSDEAAELYCAEQLKQLKEENERLKEQREEHRKAMLGMADYQKSLTEQVESLKQQNISQQELSHSLGVQCNRLREREKDITDTLKQTIAGYKSWDQPPVVIIELLESLLSKVKQ